MSTSRRSFLAQLAGASAASLARGAWPRAFASQDSRRARLITDRLRPQFHLLPPANWMNDPCGPIFVAGRYHMFFQYNPDGAYWGDMHWAHSTSPDMVHWRHEPVALAPTPGSYDRDGVFSGCAVLDHGVPTVIYTGVAPPASAAEATLRDGQHTWREVQCLAFSRDGLRTWQKAPAPVISSPPAGLPVTGFRDPCVWREGADWMLALGSGIRGQGGAVLLYHSSNLRHWTYLHPLIEGKAKAGSSANPVDSGEMWECPDFFPLGSRHVLLISTAGKVLWHVGKYEQRRFQAEKTGVVDSGAYYAARTMLDREGNRVLWGWIPERRPESEYRAAGWAGVMSLPRLLSLAADGSLRMEPAPALGSLRGRHVLVAPATADLAAFQGELARLRIQHPAVEIGVELASVRPFRMQLILHDESLADVDYQPHRRGSELRLNHVLASLPPAKSKSTAMRLFLDGSVLELFAAGKTVITDRVYRVPDSSLHINLESAPASLEIWQMNPISPDRLTS